VDDGEVGFWELFCHDLERRGPGETGHHDRVATVFGKAAQGLLALCVVGDLELDIFNAGLALELLGTVERSLVEGLVELAAEIKQQTRLYIFLREGTGAHRSRGQKAQNKTLHMIHTLSVALLLLFDGTPRQARKPPSGREQAPALRPLLHGAGENSRRILTGWKRDKDAVNGRPFRLN